MKNIVKYSWIILLLISYINTKAQIQNPAHWRYGLKKLANGRYEVHLLATMDSGWHIYAQKQSPDAIAVPTKIAFSKTVGLTLTGNPTELGKKEKHTVQELGITNMEYTGKVDFVQKVTVKPGIKEIKGTISYQTCTNEMCLPEKTIYFVVPIP